MSTESADLAGIGEDRLRVSPRQARAQKTIHRILDAAGELISEQGASSLRTSRIAERADMPIGLIYRYFKDVAAIERAFVDRVMQQVEETLLAALEPLTESVDVDTDVDVLIDAILARFADSEGAVELIRSIAATESYQQANRQSNIRLAERMAVIYRKVGLKGDEAELRLHARVQAEIGSTMQLLAWTAESEAEAAAVITEWKKIAKAYASLYL